MASPLHPLAVYMILQYITQVDQPIPSHLLSQPLRQRHHFLGIAPDDPVAYLSWPADDAQNEKAVRLLEGVDVREQGPEGGYDVRYSGDTSSIFAHVRVPTTADPATSLRLMFQWEEKDASWRYHNVGLMPFPNGCYSKLGDVPSAKDDQQLKEAVEAERGATNTHDEDDNNSYWNSYGADHDEVRHQPNTKDTSNDDSEDAYWAQYSSVHGTADSTIPSPLPTSRRRMHNASDQRSYFSDTPQTPQTPHEDEPVGYPARGAPDSAAPAEHARASASSTSNALYLNGTATSNGVNGSGLNGAGLRANLGPGKENGDIIISVPYDSIQPPTQSRYDKISPFDLAYRLHSLGMKDAKVVGVGSGLNGHDTPALEVPEDISSKDMSPYWNGFGSKANGDHGSDAVKASIRGIYQLWIASGREKERPVDEFLTIVKEALA